MILNVRLFIAAAVLVAGGLPMPLQAQQSIDPRQGRALRQNCAQDYEQFCSGNETDPLPLEIACLRQSFLNLSPSCKKSLRAAITPSGGETQPGTDAGGEP